MNSQSRFGKSSSEDELNKLALQPAPFLFDRRGISYLIGHSPQRAYMLLAELDFLSFQLTYYQEKRPFTRLLSEGYSSRLIEDFAYSESQGKKDYSIYIGSDERTVLSRDEIQQPGDSGLTDTRMHIKGLENIKQIGKRDPLFFVVLFQASADRVLKFKRVDLCIDFSTNYMLLLVEPVREGKVQSLGPAQLRMYGIMAGKALRGSACGFTSKLFKELSVEKGAELKIETLYLGSDKNITHVITFYDKQLQKAVRSQQQVLTASRLEVRLNTKTTAIYSQLLPYLVLSLAGHQGWLYRQLFLFVITFAFMRVSTVQQLTGAETRDYLSQNRWCSWWQRLYDLLSCPFWSEDETQNHPVFAEFCAKMHELWTNKANPEVVMDFFNQFFVDRLNLLQKEDRSKFSPHNSIQAQLLPQVFSEAYIEGNGDYSLVDCCLLVSSIKARKLSVAREDYYKLLLSREVGYKKQAEPADYSDIAPWLHMLYGLKASVFSHNIWTAVERFNYELALSDGFQILLPFVAIAYSSTGDFLYPTENPTIEELEERLISCGYKTDSLNLSRLVEVYLESLSPQNPDSPPKVDKLPQGELDNVVPSQLDVEEMKKPLSTPLLELEVQDKAELSPLDAGKAAILEESPKADGSLSKVKEEQSTTESLKETQAIKATGRKRGRPQGSKNKPKENTPSTGPKLRKDGKPKRSGRPPKNKD